MAFKIRSSLGKEGENKIKEVEKNIIIPWQKMLNAVLIEHGCWMIAGLFLRTNSSQLTRVSVLSMLVRLRLVIIQYSLKEKCASIFCSSLRWSALLCTIYTKFSVLLFLDFLCCVQDAPFFFLLNKSYKEIQEIFSLIE